MDNKDNSNDQFNNNLYNGYNNYSNGYSEDDGFTWEDESSYTMSNNGNVGYSNMGYNQINNMNYDMNSYVNSEYNYYDDNAAYIYDDRYEIDYSNSSSNYIDYGYNNEYAYGYNNYVYNNYNADAYNSSGEYNSGGEYNQAMPYGQNGFGVQDDVSIEDISTKMDMNLDADMFFEGFETAGNGGFSNNGQGAFNNNQEANYGYGKQSVQGSGYGSINSGASYFNRNMPNDNKLIPTDDITFDDMYVVKNQLFEEEEKLFGFNDIISLALCVGFAVIMAFLINRYAGQITTVDGHSMEYNFADKEVLVLDKLSYKIKEPERYDVVVFPVGSGTEYNYFVKRIIGLPNEKIYIDVDTSAIYANGKKLDDVYGWEPLSGYGKQIDTNNITLGPDEYYCMGDNRNNSEDSRSARVGPIKRDNFVGKAIFKISPMSSFGLIDHHVNEQIITGKKQKPFELDQ